MRCRSTQRSGTRQARGPPGALRASRLPAFRYKCPTKPPIATPATAAQSTSTATQRHAPGHVMGTEQSQPEHHEWKCSAIIPPGCSRTAEAQWLGVERMLHLHIAREDRICRRENRAEQNRSPTGRPSRHTPTPVSKATVSVLAPKASLRAGRQRESCGDRHTSSLVASGKVANAGTRGQWADRQADSKRR